MAGQDTNKDELPSTDREGPLPEAPPKNMNKADFGDFIRSTEHYIVNQKIMTKPIWRGF